MIFKNWLEDYATNHDQVLEFLYDIPFPKQNKQSDELYLLTKSQNPDYILYTLINLSRKIAVFFFEGNEI